MRAPIKHNMNFCQKLHRTSEPTVFILQPFSTSKKNLKVWITEKCQGGIDVSTNVLCLKAMSVEQKLDISKESFKASKCWGYGFMKHYAYGFSILWRKTTIAQRLSQDNEEKLIRFQHFFIAQKSMTVLTTGHKKDRFTVMVAQKEAPTVCCLQTKDTSKEHELSGRGSCQVSGQGLDGPRTDAGLAEDRLKQSWRSDQKKSMLVWDSFGAHLSPLICNTLKSLNIESTVISCSDDKYVASPGCYSQQAF